MSDDSFLRLKNGTMFYGLYCPWSKYGDVHDRARAIEFPDGTKVREYRYEFDLIDGDVGAKLLTGSIETKDNGMKFGAMLTAESITYPDGRKVENPPADEIKALFLEEGREVQVRIGGTIRLGTFLSEGKWGCRSLNVEMSDKVNYLSDTEEEAFEQAVYMIAQLNGEMDYRIDNSISRPTGPAPQSMSRPGCRRWIGCGRRSWMPRQRQLLLWENFTPIPLTTSSTP